MLLDFAAARAYQAVCGRPWPAWNPERYYRIPAAAYHHDLLKNYSTDEARWGGRFPLRTNSLGFRDAAVRDVPLAHAGRRIVVIGDSFTEGLGVAHEATFAGRIGSALEGAGEEVLNAGVTSYFPAIYYRKTKHLIEDVGLKFEELIVAIDVSDAEDEVHFDLVDDVVRPNRFHERAAEAVKTNSILFWTILDSVRGLLVEQATPPPRGSLRLDPDGKSDAEIEAELRRLSWVGTSRGNWPHDERLYRGFAEAGVKRMIEHMDLLLALLRAKGIELTVVVYPWPDQILAGDPDCIHVRTWREWCERRRVPFVDVFPKFEVGSPFRRRAEIIEACYIPGDVHLTEEGHRRLAEAILEGRGVRGR